MNAIPKSRLIIYFIILGVLPILFVAGFIFTKLQALDQKNYNLQNVLQLALKKERKQSLNMLVVDHFKNKDHFYIDKNLETLSFLEPETEALKTLVNNKYFAGDESVKRRLEFLTGQRNSLLFSEGNVQTYPFFQETVATLVHPIEVNIEDLKEILAIVEGPEIGDFKPGQERPQLIILDFSLDKREATEKNDVFLLNLKLLKREYSS